jgi:outer membrane protein assembly factor BamD
MNKNIIFILLIIFLAGCSKKNAHLDEDLSPRYEKAINYFNKGKYGRAKDEFDYIIMADPGSKIANESQYYMAESMFQIEEYDEASIAFDRYVRFSPDYSKIEKARYRICECAINLSNSYQREQSQTHRALEQLQMFIEDFPASDLIDDAEDAMLALRLKLAQKDYEVGRMYLKLEEYDSALIYFRSVLNHYYDTSFSDDARVGIIFTHILNDNREGAKSYFKSQKERFLSENKYKEAETLLQDTETGLKLAQYYQLYK